MGRLVVCRASAGTGKTRSICDVVVERIVERDLDPARILATTFTLEAAAELKRRIQSRLLTEPSLTPDRRLELAERLELANIGTVDAVAYHILDRYAFDLGLSPKIRVADEAATTETLEMLVAQIDPEPWAELHRAAQPLEIDGLTRLVLDLLEVQRANAISEAALQEQLMASAERLIEVLAPDGPLAGVSHRPRLAEITGPIHDAMSEVDDSTKVTGKALEALRRWSVSEDHTWHELLRAAKLEAGKRSGADALLGPLRAAVGVVRRHPALHEDIRHFMRQVAEVTTDLAERYRSFKAARGLLDFRDLEIEVLRLLSLDRSAAQLASEIDLLVVDEFQDTDPLQLAIFLELRERVPESYWVGDEKQAIYGFRGTDARLTRAVWDSATVDERRRLDTCYRSRPRLVELARELFVDRLGKSVDVQCGREETTPSRASTDTTRLSARHEIERWTLEAWRRDHESEAIANGVTELIAEGVPRGDIAILVRTNREALAIGQALRSRAVPCVTELPGVVGTREAVLAIAGLRLLADRRDSLAAAQLIHHLPGTPPRHPDGTPAWLESRLAERKRDPRCEPFSGDEAVVAIDRIRSRARLATPREALAAVIETLRLPQRVVRLGEPARRLGHLDALLGLASEYESVRHAAARPATVTGLLGYLEHLREYGEDVSLPQSGLDSVAVVTYHGAKGLQWPVVVLTSLGYDSPADLWRPEATGAVDLRGGTPLSDRKIRYWPWPFGKSASGWGRRSNGDGLEADALATEEGLAARAEQESELVRLLYVGVTRARDRVIFAARDDRTAWLDRLPRSEGVLAGRTIDRVRTLRPGNATTSTLESYRWLESPTVDSTRRLVRAEWSPSDLEASADSGFASDRALRPERLAEDIPHAGELHAEPPREGRDRLGEAWHAYLASLPATPTCSTDVRLEIARRCFDVYAPQAPRVEDAYLRTVVASGERFREWVGRRFPHAQWYPETPLVAPRREGGRWNGVADLVLRLPNGDHVLIDHKSSDAPEERWTTIALRYAPQLDAYTEILEHQHAIVDSRWIHLPVTGGIIAVGRRPADSSSTAGPVPWVQPELF